MSRHVDSGGSEAPVRPTGRGLLLLPALTFLVGLLLGAGLVWVSVDGEDRQPGAGGQQQSESAAEPPDETTSTTGPSSSEAATACLEAAGQADEVMDLGREIAGALADLDAVRMRTLLDRLETLEPRVRQSIETCRGLADGAK